MPVRGILRAISAASLLLILAIGRATPASKAKEIDADRTRAIAAYLAGRYADALPDLERIHLAGSANGSDLYMLAFCYDSVKHDADASGKTYADAQVALEREVAARKPQLESYFYLSNLYLYVRRDPEKSRATATAGLQAIDAKKIKVGKDGTAQFRAGKLAADAGKDDRSLEFYRRAIDAYSNEKTPPPAYLSRALNGVARADLGRSDPVVVADMWRKLLELDPSVPGGRWSLGLASLRAGRWQEAHDAFQKVKEADPLQSDEAFYALSIASAAADHTKSGGMIPLKDSDGKSFESLDASEIEKRIGDDAKAAQEVVTATAAVDQVEILPPVREKGRRRVFPGPAIAKRIAEIRGRFLALAIQMLVRGTPLQEKAFQGGYAPFVIQDWTQLWRNAHTAMVEDAPAVSGPPPAKPSVTPVPQPTPAPGSGARR